jgi:hypothetical protein
LLKNFVFVLTLSDEFDRLFGMRAEHLIQVVYRYFVHADIDVEIYGLDGISPVIERYKPCKPI